MITALVGGALVGLGLLVMFVALTRPQPGIDVLVARIDAGRRSLRPLTASQAEGDSLTRSFGRIRSTLGDRLEVEVVARGWRLHQTRQDLAVMGRSLGQLLATKVLFALGALLWVPALGLVARNVGAPVPAAVPAALTLLAAGFAFVLPDLVLRGEAADRRKDFRHVVGAFLDLVAMNLAGGRGLPEALLAASSIGDHWAMARIRQALANARLVGNTPWEGLGQLGADTGVDELTDMAGALALAADDGAKIRISLSARAASLRRKELAEVEGQAGEQSQSMLVAQMLICASFLVFLAYPAVIRISSS